MKLNYMRVKRCDMRKNSLEKPDRNHVQLNRVRFNSDYRIMVVGLISDSEIIKTKLI